MICTACETTAEKSYSPQYQWSFYILYSFKHDLCSRRSNINHVSHWLHFPFSHLSNLLQSCSYTKRGLKTKRSPQLQVNFVKDLPLRVLRPDGHTLITNLPCFDGREFTPTVFSIRTNSACWGICWRRNLWWLENQIMYTFHYMLET